MQGSCSWWHLLSSFGAVPVLQCPLALQKTAQRSRLTTAWHKTGHFFQLKSHLTNHQLILPLNYVYKNLIYKSHFQSPNNLSKHIKYTDKLRIPNMETIF